MGAPSRRWQEFAVPETPPHLCLRDEVLLKSVGLITPETEVLLSTEQVQHGQQQCRIPHTAPSVCLNPALGGATSTGSMYYDEDGDLAHEFYEEMIVTKNGRKRAKLKRIHKNLIPQGIVKLDHPRIHVDFPVVLCEV
ncbi:uncharacterized protein LOC102345350 isoform X1 [Latimeria chalumnae]|uniref:uncharacterized protein LOC102345350 isoform X1 n=1 Tax=Latimeria chalumnae TaxID=7897 RepID=UPI00313CFACA